MESNGHGTDHYLLFKLRGENPWYLNAGTFQEEVLEHPGDRLQRHNPLYHDWETHRIQLSSGREEPLFLALPSHLGVGYYFSSRGSGMNLQKG